MPHQNRILLAIAQPERMTTHGIGLNNDKIRELENQALRRSAASSHWHFVRLGTFIFMSAGPLSEAPLIANKERRVRHGSNLFTFRRFRAHFPGLIQHLKLVHLCVWRAHSGWRARLDAEIYFVIDSQNAHYWQSNTNKNTLPRTERCSRSLADCMSLSRERGVQAFSQFDVMNSYHLVRDKAST